MADRIRSGAQRARPAELARRRDRLSGRRRGTTRVQHHSRPRLRHHRYAAALYAYASGLLITIVGIMVTEHSYRTEMHSSVFYRWTGAVFPFFLCMLALHLAWHMRRALAPILFDDDDRGAAEAARPSPVAAAKPSPAAAAKAAGKRTRDGRPVHSFRTLLQDLATLTRNTVRLGDGLPATMLARPTPLQQDAFDRLGIAIAA